MYLLDWRVNMVSRTRSRKRKYNISGKPVKSNFFFNLVECVNGNYIVLIIVSWLYKM